MGKRSPRLLIAEPKALLVTIALLNSKALDVQIAQLPDFARELATYAFEVLQKAKWEPIMQCLAGYLPTSSGFE